MVSTFSTLNEQNNNTQGKTVTTSKKTIATLSTILILMIGCSGGDKNVVATAAGHDLTIDQVVEMLARQNTLPNQAIVIETLADYWIDYTLMGELSLEDSTLANLDLNLILRQELEEELVNRYLESVIQFDTVLSEEQLQQAWNEAPPADSVRAAHILLALPETATEFEIDSLFDLGSGLKGRLDRGESFGSIAQLYSDDTGNSSVGGDLGFFLPGMLMPELEEVAYNLQVGQTSEPFISPSGIHLLRVTDRRAMDFQSSVSQFRQMMVERTINQAYSDFLNDIVQSKDIRISIESSSIVRELARNTEAGLSSSALNRSLVDYADGSFTVQEGLDFLRTLGRDLLDQLADGPEETLDQLLMDLTQSRILVELAIDEEIHTSEGYVAHQDSLFVNFLDMLKMEADAVGLWLLSTEDGETTKQALDRITLQLIRELLAGRNPPSFQQITVGARRRLDWSVNDQAVLATLERLDELQGFSTEPSNGSVIDPTSTPQQENITDSIGVN